jgi:hypothetical protein
LAPSGHFTPGFQVKLLEVFSHRTTPRTLSGCCISFVNSGNPDSMQRTRYGPWIPAYAGMTEFGFSFPME